jgi:hypothetical protein
LTHILLAQAFADVAYADCADASHFPSVDACYILCFAVIMLNTDLHNPNIRPEKRMTLEQFLAHNRNYGDEVSKGVDLPTPWLTSIYHQIRSKEINTMREGSALTAEVSKDRWTDLLTRQREARFVHHDSASAAAFDRAMFERVWQPTLAALSVVFDSGQPGEQVRGGRDRPRQADRFPAQPEALHTALEGFLTLAKVSAKFDMSGAFDSVLAAICKFTSLLVYAPASQGGGAVDESASEDGARLLASVKAFGNHHKAQVRGAPCRPTLTALAPGLDGHHVRVRGGAEVRERDAQVLAARALVRAAAERHAAAAERVDHGGRGPGPRRTRDVSPQGPGAGPAQGRGEAAAEAGQDPAGERGLPPLPAS